MSLLVTVTGSSTVKVTEVTLANSLGQAEVNGTLQACFSAHHFLNREVEEGFTVDLISHLTFWLLSPVSGQQPLPGDVC